MPVLIRASAVVVVAHLRQVYVPVLLTFNAVVGKMNCLVTMKILLFNHLVPRAKMQPLVALVVERLTQASVLVLQTFSVVSKADPLQDQVNR